MTDTPASTPTPETTFTPKSDSILAEEVYRVLQAVVAKVNEMLAYDLVVSFNLSTSEDGKTVSIANFGVIKKIVSK